MRQSVLIFCLCVLSVTSLAAESWNMADLRMKKRFGIGASAGGPLSMFGLEADFNLTEDLGISTGIGTGLQYSTFMVKGRYFLLGETVSPYIALGVARWWTDGTRETRVSPSVLANRFLGPDTDLSNGFSVWFLSPAIGVQFMHRTGFSVFAEVQYFFKLINFANGTYAGAGIHFYL